jgi:elongation factor P
MISTGEFKKGGRILVDQEPYTVEDYTVQTPSARGAATLVRCKLRNIVSGVLVERTFKAGEKFEVPDVSYRRIQFLYDDGESCHFMDTASYDQFSLGHDGIEEMVPWLAEGLLLDSVVWDGKVVGVRLPQYVEAQVDMVGGGSRGDTASGKNLKEAKLTNGLTVKVPLFIESGERILVDPRTGEFVRRAGKAAP